MNATFLQSRQPQRTVKKSASAVSNRIFMDRQVKPEKAAYDREEGLNIIPVKSPL